MTARRRRAHTVAALTVLTLTYEALMGPSFAHAERPLIDPVQLPDVLGERPVILFGKWKGNPGGQLVVEGRTASGPYRNTMPIATHVSGDTAALRYLWARHRIAALSDQEALEGGEGYKKAITELGLQYNLLTQYTSFLAVDKLVRNPQPQDTPSVNQPSPMPQGVSNTAIAGAEVPGTPEPATWGAAMVALSVLAMVMRRSRRAKADRFTA